MKFTHASRQSETKQNGMTGNHGFVQKSSETLQKKLVLKVKTPFYNCRQCGWFLCGHLCAVEICGWKSREKDQAEPSFFWPSLKYGHQREMRQNVFFYNHSGGNYDGADGANGVNDADGADDADVGGDDIVTA